MLPFYTHIYVFMINKYYNVIKLILFALLIYSLKTKICGSYQMLKFFVEDLKKWKIKHQDIYEFLYNSMVRD